MSTSNALVVSEIASVQNGLDFSSYSQWIRAGNALVMPEITSTGTGFDYFPDCQWLTDLPSRNVEAAAELFKAKQSAANDDYIDTSLESSKAPATFSRPTPRKLLAPAELLAEWSGCVTSIQAEGHYFSAALIGVHGEGVKDEEEDATIPLADVSEGDRDLLRPGSYFRLCVMFEISSSGQPRRYTQVIFRRLPAYRSHDLEEAMERGRALARGLRVE